MMKGSQEKKSVRGLYSFWKALKKRPDPDRIPPSIGTLVDLEIRRLGLDERIGYEEILAGWPSVAGSFLAAQTKPESLHHGVLTVLVTNPSVHYTLAGLKGKLIANINKSFGASKVKDIRFKIG